MIRRPICPQGDCCISDLRQFLCLTDGVRRTLTAQFRQPVMSESLYVVDTFSLMYQVFHAIRQPMTGTRGQPTNAVYGFTRDLKHLLNDIQPTYAVCALDSPGPGKRNEVYADYKANRAEMPEDLRPQISMIRDVIEAHRIPAISCEGWEADDVIATLACQATANDMDVCIVSNDKDLRQLLGPRVRVYNLRKKQYLDVGALKQDWGIRPDQVVDFQALVGDTVDNVPGVPLVGPKKASALLNQFGSLDAVLANASQAPGKKLQENLKNFAAQARLSRELVELNSHLPLEIDWESARVGPPDADRLVELFTDFAFGSYTDEARAAQTGTPQTKMSERTWETIDTQAKFDGFLAELQRQDRFCVDLETTGLDALQADIVGWAFCWQPRSAYYIPVGGPAEQDVLDHSMVLSALRPALENPAVEVVNQNIKYDMLVLRRAGVELRGIGLDPMVGDYLLEAGARTHNLDSLAQRYLGHRTIPISDLIGSGKRQKKMFEVDIPKAAEYASEDADVAWQVAEKITGALKQEGLWELYWDLERPLIPVLADMESAGIRVDVSELRQQSEGVTARLERLVEEIHEIAGRSFNIDSPKQLSQILFDELNLPVLKRTKTGASTNHDVLERLAPLHPLPAKVIEHRQLTKLKGTYLDALPELVHPETGRIHASFNQVVTATGRLSSSEPNLQNVPIRTAEGRRVRRAFIPSEPGWKLVCADYSQIELRMLAHFSEDPVLVDAFRNGVDIHTAVAADVFGVASDQVSSDQRRVAKAVNFGVIYGQTSFGLAAALGIEQDKAARFIDDYFARYARVDRYLEELLDECEATGYARTILGRRRAISGIRTPRPKQRNLSERTAINTVIQGSAADLIKRAMIRIHDRMASEHHPGRLLLQIHDELIFEVPEPDLDSLIDLAKNEMETAIDLKVPLVVDVKVGDNWLDAVPV